MPLGSHFTRPLERHSNYFPLIMPRSGGCLSAVIGKLCRVAYGYTGLACLSLPNNEKPLSIVPISNLCEGVQGLSLLHPSPLGCFSCLLRTFVLMQSLPEKGRAATFRLLQCLLTSAASDGA